MRESRSPDAAKKLGLVLDHELTAERFFYVMEYVPGQSLSLLSQQMHASSGPEGLDNEALSNALKYIADLLKTLDAYHQGGLWHKDVKPISCVICHKMGQAVQFPILEKVLIDFLFRYNLIMPDKRIASIDLLRGLVMVIMALDHVRMYFGFGTWYSDPTNLAETTPLLFLTRWFTHFCAPVFVMLAGTSAFLYGVKRSDTKTLSRFLLTRGLWLVFVELVIINFAWTFDITYSYRILQVIWAIGISMIVLSALVFLPVKAIAIIGLMLVFGHNLLDPIKAYGAFPKDILWYGDVALEGRIRALAEEGHAPTPLVPVELGAELQRRVVAQQPLPHLQRCAGVGPGLAEADRDLCAVREAGLEGRVGLAVDHRDLVALL